VQVNERLLLPCCPVVAQRGPRRQRGPEASLIPYHPPSHYAGFTTLHPVERLTVENTCTSQFAGDASVAKAVATEADMSAQVTKFIPQCVR
jgi:hypothetical protein